MIIRALRLKNIKSYGAGPDGDGVWIRFEPGVNRIAGRNGEGKSTLIESLGYALFLTRPVYEEGFDTATYLLRSGCKAGEIDVVFEMAGEVYRLERGLGSQSKRRTKVILVRDGSTEAEDDREVSQYLCRLFQVESEDRCCELFSKLVGVKQGRLTWPFDSKPAEARKHFEPLLAVAVFRDCFDKLKPVVDQFEEQIRARATEEAVLLERIRAIADSPEKVQQARERLTRLDQQLQEVRSAKVQADARKDELEKQERALRQAKDSRDAAAGQLELARLKRAEDQKRLQEAEQAQAILNASKAGHASYQIADQALRALQARQSEKLKLQRARSAALNLKTEWEGKTATHRRELTLHSQDQEAKANAVRLLGEQLETGKAAYAAGETDFQRRMSSLEAARRARATLHGQRQLMGAHLQKHATQREEILELWKKVQEWDASALAQARDQEQQAEKEARLLNQKLAATRQLQESLATQFQQIRGGICPFLVEECRQFDPRKVQGDLSQIQKQLEHLGKEATRALDTHRKTQAALEHLTRKETQVSEWKHSALGLTEALRTSLSRGSAPLSENEREGVHWLIPDQAAALLLVHQAKVVPPETAWAGGNLNTAEIAGWVEWETRHLQDFEREFRTFDSALEKQIADLDKQKAERLAASRDLEHVATKRREMEIEISHLLGRIRSTQQALADAEKQADAAAKRTVELESALATFAHLEEDLQRRQTEKDAAGEAYRAYLGAEPVAGQGELRRVAVGQSTEAEARALLLLQQVEQVYEQARQSFDPTALQLARRRAEEMGEMQATALLRRDNAQDELTREERRQGDWQTAQEARAKVGLELERLRACAALTQKARQILQKTGPLVAERICQRIALQAQQTFNSINHEPIELEWIAERFSLRIQPGERRFAMLSGGEQTKLALAMILALIQEFSALRFCVFDEPTYGVDAESRHKLADSILQLQSGATPPLDQLLLVSHDDAFDGKIENVVLVRKTARDGSTALVAGADGS